MSETGILVIVCASMIPITAAVVGLVSKWHLSHIKDTQVIGGTPREVFEQKANFDLERKRVEAAARRKKVNVREVLS